MDQDTGVFKMDYRLLKDWQKEVKETTLQKATQLFNRLNTSRPLFEKPYLEWMYGITPEEPVAYYSGSLSPPIFPKLWATLPFYKLNFVDIRFSFRNKKDFQRWYGMDIETFKILCEYGRIKPLIGSPLCYRNKHFLDPILRESVCDEVNFALIMALRRFAKERRILFDQTSKKIFPRNPMARAALRKLILLGFWQVPTKVKGLLAEQKISKRKAEEALYNADFYYSDPILQTGGGTLILHEDSAKWFDSWGFDTRVDIQTEVREELLKWLGFRLPEKVDRKYISKYIEVCDDLSPSLHKVVLKIEKKARRFENAREELKIIIQNLESELALITKRRNTLSGAISWVSAFPLSIVEDSLDRLGFKRTSEDLETAKVTLKDFILGKVGDSEKTGEIIAAITRKGYLVRNIWSIKEKTEKLSN